MFNFNLKPLKENYRFLLISSLVVILFLVLSLVIKKDVIKEELLLPTGKNNISKLVINEIQSNNDGTIMAPDGGVYDWIEIYNGEAREIDLSEYSLSDTIAKEKWAFPAGTILKPGEYLVVFLSGQNNNGLIANFKISSNGNETIILRNHKKDVVDAVSTLPLSKNQVMGRDLGGAWHIYNEGTPGFINTMDGYNAYISSLTSSEKSDLIINEALPNNKGRFKNNNGEYCGYIELKNNGTKSINLKNYTVSNEKAKPFKYNLPNLTLNKNEIFLLYTCGKSKYENNEYSAGFKLENKTGSVILSYGGKIIDTLDYENVANGLALIRDKDDFIKSADLTPGLENTANSKENFSKNYLKTSKSLIISEVLPSNYSYLPHNGGKYYDYIELYNNSGEDIKLSDYCLSDDDTNCSTKLPDITLKKGDYYVFMASGDVNLTNSTYTHLDFKIGDNDTIYLFKNSSIIDTLFVPKLDPGYSYGKNSKYGEYYYKEPTPLKENPAGIIALASPPTFNQVGGIYNDIDKLMITIKGEGTIYYTTDGTKPTTSSTKYTEAISIAKTTVIKAISSIEGKRNSEVVTNSYIVNENHTVPVMSLSLEPSDFKYLNKNAWTVGIEVPSYTEFFDNTDGFNIASGLRLFGGSTRGPAKKSYAIKFKKQYGEGTLNYQVFENRDYSTFESLVLRTASQDENRAIIRDILGTSLVDGVTKAYVQAYKTIILYINGEYWGLYWIREKVDENYVSNNFNVPTTGTDILRVDGELNAGSKDAYNNLINYIKSHDMADDEAYKHVSDLIDIESLIDFWVAENYVTNNDIVNFRYFRNPELDNGKWKFVFYDLDWAFYNYPKNYYSFATSSSGMGPQGYTTILLRSLIKNKDFKSLFVKRTAYQLKHVWNKDRINEFMTQQLNEIEPELERNLTRWKLKKDEHLYQLGRLKTYIEERENYMIKQTKSFFNVSDKEWNDYYEAA